MNETNNEYIGLTEDEAKNLAASNGLVTRTLCREGEQFFGTCDYRTDRLTFSVTNGKVDSARVG